VSALVEPCENNPQKKHIILQRQTLINKYIMKTVKKVAANFKKMDAAQMKKIKGGYWLEHTDSTGKVTRIWV